MRTGRRAPRRGHRARTHVQSYTHAPRHTAAGGLSPYAVQPSSESPSLPSPSLHHQPGSEMYVGCQNFGFTKMELEFLVRHGASHCACHSLKLHACPCSCVRSAHAPPPAQASRTSTPTTGLPSR